MLFPSQHKTGNSHSLYFLNFAEALFVQVEINVGAGEYTGIPSDPLFGTLIHEKSSYTLSEVIFTARIFEVIFVP